MTTIQPVPHLNKRFNGIDLAAGLNAVSYQQQTNAALTPASIKANQGGTP
jgi:hypothetical protein